MKTFPVIYLCYCSTWRHNIFLARFFTGGYEKHKKELLRIRHAKTDFFSDNVNSSNIFLLDGNPKLFNTMTITNLIIEDDSRYGNIGSYECHELRFLISTKKNALKTDKILISGQKEFMKKMVEGWQSDHCLVTCLRSEDAKASTLDMITFTRLSVWASGLRLRKRKTSKLDVMTKETWTQNHKKKTIFLRFDWIFHSLESLKINYGVIKWFPALEKAVKTHEKIRYFFTCVWYRQSAARTSLAFRATRSGWWMNGKAFTVINSRSFVGLWPLKIRRIRITFRQWRSNFPRRERKPKYGKKNRTLRIQWLL